MKNGNAETMKGMGQFGNFSGKVNQHLWSVLKPEIEAGGLNLADFDDTKTKQAIRRGFFVQKPDLGLNIGKVKKAELADLSVWDLKKLYSLFYQQVFGLYLDFPDELMPEASDEFAWPVCVPGIISAEASFSGGKLNFPRWKCTDKVLDSVLDLNRGRDALIHSYIVRARPNWEADEYLKHLSGNNIKSQGINVLMFRERLILGNFLDWLTGEKLDRKTRTLSGSRYVNGNVPYVFWHEGRLNVYWSNPDDAYSSLRSRQAVS